MTDEHGIQAENTVEEICQQLFGRDLVLRSPVLVEKSGRKELTDVLVIVDDIAIIVQSKSLAVETSELDKTKFGRIHKRHSRAKRQLNTTLNAQSRNATVRAMTSTGISFNVDWSRIQHRIGVITLSLSDAAYEDPEDRFQFPYPCELFNGIEVHTFLLADLVRMSSELTTPADVLVYLRARAQCIKARKFLIGNELDFLAIFKTRYPEIEKALTDSVHRVTIIPGSWEKYHQAHAEKIYDRHERFRNSFLIDEFIDHHYTAVDHSVNLYGLSHQESAIRFMTVIGKLGKLMRVERALIGDKFIEKFEKTRTNKWGYFIFISQLMNIGYLFLILNEEDQEKRINFLYYLSEQTCHSIACRDLVGIGTIGAQQKNEFGHDFIILDVETIKSETETNPRIKLFQPPVVAMINEWDS
jgi:hypothetical protein